MGREFELKYRATPEQLAALREHYSGFHRISMETTYYDTAERLLSPRHWTLRRRLENGISVCTLKTPAAGGARGEWETECGDILSAVPALCKLGVPALLPALVSEGVQPVCAARFTRLAATLTLPGCTLELALDEGVLLGGNREIPLCEVEVELKSGEEDAATAFAGELAHTFGLVPEKKSKYRRALALAQNET